MSKNPPSEISNVRPKQKNVLIKDGCECNDKFTIYLDRRFHTLKHLLQVYNKKGTFFKVWRAALQSLEYSIYCQIPLCYFSPLLEHLIPDPHTPSIHPIAVTVYDRVCYSFTSYTVMSLLTNSLKIKPKISSGTIQVITLNFNKNVIEYILKL